MQHIAKTSTAMALTLALVTPASAQTGLSEEQVSEICAAASAPMVCAQSLLDGVSQGTLALNAEGGIETPFSINADGTIVPESPAEAETEAESEAVAEPEPEPEPEVAAESEAEAETGTETSQQEQPPEPETAAEPEAEPEVTEQAEEAPEAQENEPQDAAAPETDAQTDTAEPTEEPAQTETAETAADDPETEAQPEADAITEQPDVAAETEAEAEAEAEPSAETATSPEQQESATADGTDEAAQTDAAQAEQVVQEDTAESTQAANETPEVAATAAEGDESMEEVEAQVVTDEDVRSSSEDFDTSANAQAAPAATADQSDSGLNNFEKFALGAAGIALLSQLVDNGADVVSNSGDRVVVRRDNGDYQVLKDDDVLIRRPGSEVRTRTFDDGSTRTIVTRPDGLQVETIRAANGQVLRRERVFPDGRRVVLFDDTTEAQPVDVSTLPTRRPERAEDADLDYLRRALEGEAQQDVVFERRFTLQQIRQIRAVRELVPEIELSAVQFDTGSAAIRASEAEELRDLGVTMRQLIEDSPNEVFLVEGHTDAVGAAGYNLALSDRRAESVALALTEYFDVPPENMIVQGYGEANLKVVTPEAERQNRRATVRRITPLLQSASR
ncbi:OmpA family protein [Litoreibacter arenae]|uniref:Outer membrane protein n=1 Tax=Litoreibacter arenae DSM 19593 TaxID=1123360 RepID=S9QI25_9RHOB|nr:OmpA family protein [Litoreibacter arenae]EPX79223.1 Outer membrane protein [Litoreibacter arenae DSM 19593]